MKRLSLLVIAFFFPILACNLEEVLTETTTPSADQGGMIATATLTTTPGETEAAPETFASASPAPTDTPIQPSATEAITPMDVFPAGVMVGTEDGEVTIYDVQGLPIEGYLLPDLSFHEPQFIHFTQPFGPGLVETQLVYYSLEQGGVLKIHDGQSSSIYTSAPNLIAMAGTPAQPVIAYSVFAGPQVGDDTTSVLYVGTLNAPPTDPVLTILNEDGYALYPLAVSAVEGQPVGVWYTTELYGIGNVAFAPRRGLFYLDVTSGQAVTYLPVITSNEVGTFTNSLGGLSPDQTWVAYTMQGPNVSPNTMFWAPVNEPDQVKSVRPAIDYDMGAGFAVFSPDHQYFAWNTANSGTQPGSVTYYLQIHATDGVSGSFSEFPTAKSLLNPELVFARAAGWLDSETLLLQGRMTDELNHVLSLGPVSSIVSTDGEHQPIEAQSFAIGDFLGFVYP